MRYGISALSQNAAKYGKPRVYHFIDEGSRRLSSCCLALIVARFSEPPVGRRLCKACEKMEAP